MAGLTNKPVAGGRDLTKRSRGEIPLLLATESSAASAAEALQLWFRPDEFNPCWVLVGDRDALYYIDMTGPGRAESRLLPPGIHVLENRPLGGSSRKVEHVLSLLGDIRSLTSAAVMDRLGAVLGNHTMPYVPVDLGEEEERLARISACCVHTDTYGTRSAMLVHDPRPPSEPPRMWVAGGAPCSQHFSAVSFDAVPGPEDPTRWHLKSGDGLDDQVLHSPADPSLDIPQH
ncbi:MAG: NRDE family protein [Acidimicrobiales bacterium]